MVTDSLLKKLTFDLTCFEKEACESNCERAGWSDYANVSVVPPHFTYYRKLIHSQILSNDCNSDTWQGGKLSLIFFFHKLRNFIIVFCDYYHKEKIGRKKNLCGVKQRAKLLL